MASKGMCSQEAFLRRERELLGVVSGEEAPRRASNNNKKNGMRFLRAGALTQITLANLEKIFGAEEHAREIMGDVNLSGEGVINYEEFKNMMIEMPLDGRDPMTPRTPRTQVLRN